MRYLYFLLALSIFTSCVKKDLSGNVIPEEYQSMSNLQVSSTFTFKTDKAVPVSITTLDNNDQPVPDIRVNMLTDFPENGGQLISSCYTGTNGIYQSSVKLPAYTDSLVIQTNAIGFVQLQKRALTGSGLAVVLGGKNPASFGKGVSPEISATEGSLTGKLEALPYVKALGTYNSLGVPNYLITPNDIIDAAFIADINTALPESRPVPNYHPDYISQGNLANLEFLALSNVWVTFVHEGAGYRNTLCYYKYPSNNPPATTADIDTLYAIYPNTSYVNSGGGLVSGNKVSLGLFQPGTSVGWAIIANGYNGSAITAGAGAFYSNSELNPESTAALRKHCILLNDMNRGKFILSFEDLNRQAGSDNDFNDAIFYVTADPVQAIVVNNVPLPAYTTVDADHDGVTDNFDDFPLDPALAFSNFYPSENTVGTLAFEDQWPSKGDYDFNDLVVDYNFNVITNAQNQVTQIRAKIITKAIGASYHSGFGFQLPVSPSMIASVTGTDVRSAAIVRNTNGTEAGQSKAVIVVYDDAFNELPWPGSGIGVNTTPGAPYVTPDTLNVTITLSSPVAANVLGLPPYNAFIFTNKTRGNEVHLVNQPPTDLANMSLLGTSHDNSVPAAGRYYVTSQNLPFAIDVAGPFDYSIEKTQITESHTKFYSWGVSSGLQYLDWFKPLSNYRNAVKIYTH